MASVLPNALAIDFTYHDSLPIEAIPPYAPALVESRLRRRGERVNVNTHAGVLCSPMFWHVMLPSLKDAIIGSNENEGIVATEPWVPPNASNIDEQSKSLTTRKCPQWQIQQNLSNMVSSRWKQMSFSTRPSTNQRKL